jgi:hypothetical protein
MAFTDGEISDEQYNDGRISMTDQDDIRAVLDIQGQLQDKASFDSEKAAVFLEQLHAIIDRNPQDPVLYNALYNAYIVLDKEDEAARTLIETTTKFPYYFFGKANIARISFYGQDFNGIFDAFNESYTLRQLYPHRELFHVSEARNFHCLMSMYSLPTMDSEKTRFQTRAFRRLNELCGCDKNPDALVNEFNRFFDTFFEAVFSTLRNDRLQELQQSTP